MTKLLYGAVEAGGTKFVCAVGTGPDDVRALTRFTTTTPAETLGKALTFFREHEALSAVGIGSFGPLDPSPSSPTFGHILHTPKPGWSHTDVAGPFGAALSVPVAVDTDVNAAAVGEHTWGAAQDVRHVLYLTVGTGIGGGAVIDGRPLHGLLHPEMGHLLVPRVNGDDFAGSCPFHGDCLEGLAAGPALERRWGTRAEHLPEDHPAWELEAQYLARALVNYIVTLSPQRIILGGGVMHQRQLFPLIRRHTQDLLNGYIGAQEIVENVDAYIVPPALGDRAGVLGALALARQAG